MTDRSRESVEGTARPAAPNARVNEVAATEHSIDTYLPESKDYRAGVALCLSGGGFRAALFHLGALRRLNELGILSKLNAISSVSGGSIMSAHLAQRVREWPPTGDMVPDWEERVAEPFRNFTKRNLRTGPLLRRLLPWNWTKTSTAVEALTIRYEDGLTHLKLGELP